MQIDADLVKKYISDSSEVIIMAHRNLDLDALGSSLGMYYLCKTLGKNACLLIDDNYHETGVARSLNEIRRQNINLKIRKYDEIKKKLDDEILLIVLDTHVSNLVQNSDLLKIPNIIVIDHHTLSEKNNIKCKYEYIGEEQSSSVEIIIEILKHLDIYIHPYIATVMLAGIFIDTNGFYSKTNYKTHQGASFLYECGATLKELQYLLKEDAEKYIDRQKIISESQIINNHFIIATGHDNRIYNKEDLAKISDTMLLFNQIEASFTIGYIEEGVIGISARSLGNINVQSIMKELGGGGHFSDAATQITGETIESVQQKVCDLLNNLKGGF